MLVVVGEGCGCERVVVGELGWEGFGGSVGVWLSWGGRGLGGSVGVWLNWVGLG